MARPSYPSDDVDKLLLRFPEGMRDRIKEAAKVSGRSMNAEIIQRLNWSFEFGDDDELRVSLSAEVRNRLMIDASVKGMTDSDRAAEILEGTYDPTSEHSQILSKVGELAEENASLAELVSSMKEKEDADFLLYYSKVVQLRQLAHAILAVDGKASEHIAAMAREVDKLSHAEIDTLASRHDDAMFRKSLARHSRRLKEEIDQSDRESAHDDDEGPITLESDIKDRG